MLKFEVPMEPHNVSFSESTVRHLDILAEALDTSGDAIHPHITQPVNALYELGVNCGSIILANTDGVTADAIRENLTVNMNPVLVTGFCYGFQNGWNQETLAAETEALTV